MVTPLYNHANSRVVVELNQGLDSGQQIYARARRGSFGTLDCGGMVADGSGQKVDGNNGRNDGPIVDQALTKAFYKGVEWMNPTPEMIAAAQAGNIDSIIDVCIMDGDKVVWQKETDLFAAWDAAKGKGIGGKADDPSGEQTLTSPVAQAERCVDQMGEIPFFEKTADGDYTTYSCMDSTPIPMTITEGGNTQAPQSGNVNKCDNPQYIYSLCETGPRVATRINDRGTRWTLLCRKSVAEDGNGGSYASSKFNDIAMIGTNPFTGKTCFFQNALYSKTDGAHVPHPGDKTKSQNLWSGVQGGIGSGIECGRCHDADAYIHSPWIDGAKDQNGRQIVPKMGVDADFAIGANDTPYAIVNRRGQGWTMPKHITGEGANACTKCHRMGDGQWADSYLERLDGTDTSWTSITTDEFNNPNHKYWMPPDHTFASDAEWQASPEHAALKFIQDCNKNPSNAGCDWKDVPETLGGADAGGALRNPVTLSDDQLAQQATTLIGFNKNALTNICSDCHTANQLTLDDWKQKTDAAVASCFKDADAQGADVNNTSAGVRVENNEFKEVGSYEVAAGSQIEISIAGTGDIDLYVRRGAEVSKTNYDCRPFNQTSTEKCDKTLFNASGPATFYVGLSGTQDGTVKVTTKYKKPVASGMSAKERVDCMRLDPSRSDAPFNPGRIGIYAAGAHLGWFQDTFKAAYPADEGSNNADTWQLEYGKFKNRSSMPKGNHARLTQPQFDIVAEWFARGLPKASTYLPPDTGPTTCAQSISPSMQDHQSDMAVNGWSALNRAAGMNMYGCSGGGDPRSCLTSQADATTKSYGAGWTKVGKLRVLRELSFNTFYWMRSSPDGRFVANGSTGGSGAVISDLQSDKDIEVDAAYDPGFFPDGKGWMFQGTPIGAALCKISLLQSDPDKINFSESACSSVGTISLYQHLGAGLGGADYMAINSQFTSDNPSEGETSDPAASFGATSDMKFTPMVFDGSHYVGKPEVHVKVPYEGDSVLSPSTQLVISRFGNNGGQLGYVVRKVTATPNGQSYDITTSEVGRYCTTGAKPSMSFDEKYFVTHHYVTPADFAEYGYSSASDPEFKKMLDKGTSNIILVNLLTGARTRVTTMHAGQYALYPHFRSDGWFYFQVRDSNSGKEYVLASDAALTNP
ncbi:MAG TPA: PPC domain-containing protein [Kofleriaceae bacterium]